MEAKQQQGPTENHNNRHYHQNRKRPPRSSNWDARQRSRGRNAASKRLRHAAAAAPPIAAAKCSECNQENSPKYKCPKCRAPYCSIACCRTHKEKSSCNGTSTSKPNKAKSKYLPCDLQLVGDPLRAAQHQQRKETKGNDDLDEGWKITTEMMNKMDNSEWLHKELQDGGLRQVIYDIDCASNKVVVNTTTNVLTTEQEEALERAKLKYPNFGTFIDKLLVTTGVLERQANNDNDEDMEEWLERSGRGDDSLGPLVLAPIPQKPRPCWNSSSESDESSGDDDSTSEASSTSSSSSGESSDTDSSNSSS